MKWIDLTSEDQLNEILEKSVVKSQVIFKHSTRCSISSVALQRLKKSNMPDNIDFYYLDLISFRNLSNKIAQTFGVNHESPQVLVIKDRQCIYDESHLGISLDDIVAQAHAA
jgi:bacillithiol system protein YtxJ